MIFLLFLIHYVLAEGYYCPYTDLGSTTESQLLYDYYNDNDGTYWTRNGETGWMTVTEYCKNKGDLSLHSDAGEWKCNDSHLLCIWNGNNCQVNDKRHPDCKELCQAVLDNKGPQCLGNCPNGQNSNNLYSEYCEPKTSNNQVNENGNQNKNKNRNKNRKKNKNQNKNLRCKINK
jgi:hypothetical protein